MSNCASGRVGMWVGGWDCGCQGLGGCLCLYLRVSLSDCLCRYVTVSACSLPPFLPSSLPPSSLPPSVPPSLPLGHAGTTAHVPPSRARSWSRSRTLLWYAPRRAC
eukprot:3748521-Rhodomonas_salina.1